MFQNIDPIKKDLAKLASVLNQFHSEAVQVKLLEKFFQDAVPGATASPAAKAPARRGRPPKAASAEAAAKPAKRGRPPKVASAESPAKAPARRGRPPKAASAVKAAKPAKAGRRKRSKMGATGALNALLDAGFFKAHRSIAEVTEACKTKLGLEIAVTNLSGPLVRFVEENKLQRAKNKNDKFEYWAK